MNRFFSLILTGSIALLVGCVAMIPIRITPAFYPRIGLLSVYPDEASLSVSAIYFGFPKNSAMLLPGLGDELAKVLAEKLNKAGYQVEILPIKADQFWSSFETASKTKEGSSWHLGVAKNTQLTVRNLQAAGADFSGVDAVLVVGPIEHYADSRFLSRNGTGVDFAFIAKTPDKVGVNLGARALAINARSLELTGGGGAQGWAGLLPLPPGRTLATLSESEKGELIREVKLKAGKVFEDLVSGLR